MFLYWKKRGAYELEALPPSLTQLGIERYSWSSSLDAIHDLCGKLGGMSGSPDPSGGFVFVCLTMKRGGWMVDWFVLDHLFYVLKPHTTF